MGQIFGAGQLNATALIVPDIYVQIIPPTQTLLNGVPTNVVGAVGTASWGPVNAPTTVGNMLDQARIFGPIIARKYDLGTLIAAAVLQGANNFRCVRVTDGTDAAASAAVQTNCLTLTSVYTGSLGNSTTWKIENGTQANTWRLTLAIPGRIPEIFDNVTSGVAAIAVGVGGTGYTTAPSVVIGPPDLPGGRQATATATVATGAVTAITVTDPGSGYSVAPTVTLSGGAGTGATVGTVSIAPWKNFAAAVNSGQSGLRGPSGICTASAGAGTTAAAAGNGSLSGGSDGAAGITATALVGVDTVPRKGVYALRGTGASIVALADVDDSTQWSTQVSYGLSEGAYMILTGPAGDTITSAISAKGTAGVDSYAAKLMFGDWCYFNDTVNGQVRLISPQGFVAGRLANLSPEQSSLNKPMWGVVATQKTAQNSQYSNAELQQLIQAGIDVITNPIPAGSMFGCRAGHNTSSNPVINGDSYTRMTNYIAATLAAGMGRFVGKPITPKLMRQAKGTLEAFLENLANPPSSQPMIGAPDGSTPYQVVCGASNNPQQKTALGYMKADVRVTYLSINEKFLVNLEGGASVQINRTSTAQATTRGQLTSP